MAVLLVVEGAGYLGMLWLQASWRRQGVLTANRFALFQVAFLSLFVLTVSLIAVPRMDGKLIGTVLSLLLWPIGYPFARWLYRQVLSG